MKMSFKRTYLILLIALTTITNCIYTNVKTPGWFYSQSYTDVRGMDPVGKLSGQSCGEGLVLACLRPGMKVMKPQFKMRFKTKPISFLTYKRITMLNLYFSIYTFINVLV